MLVHLQPDKFARLDLLWVNMFIIVHQTTHVDDGYWPSRPLPAFTTVTGRYDRYRPLRPLPAVTGRRGMGVCLGRRPRGRSWGMGVCFTRVHVTRSYPTHPLTEIQGQRRRRRLLKKVRIYYTGQKKNAEPRFYRESDRYLLTYLSSGPITSLPSLSLNGLLRTVCVQGRSPDRSAFASHTGLHR